MESCMKRGDQAFFEIDEVQSISGIWYLLGWKCIQLEVSEGLSISPMESVGGFCEASAC